MVICVINILVILGFQKGIRVVFGINSLRDWALIINLNDGIWSGAAGCDSLINLTKFICPFIGVNPVNIIKSSTAGLSPFSVGMGIRSFILFILNLYMAFEVDILIKANFAQKRVRFNFFNIFGYFVGFSILDRKWYKIILII